MFEVEIDDKYRGIIEKYANEFNIGGYSNLGKADLSKSSRLGYQFTGLFAELGWRLFRGSSIDDFVSMLEYKVQVCKPNKIGDDGYDDHITHNNFTRKVDVKGTHVTDIDKIQYLNLIIPEREFHKNMIYVGAFTYGSTRENVTKVYLAGWTISECITKRWGYDEKKFCVPVRDLRDINRLKKYF